MGRSINLPHLGADETGDRVRYNGASSSHSLFLKQVNCRSNHVTWDTHKKPTQQNLPPQSTTGKAFCLALQQKPGKDKYVVIN